MVRFVISEIKFDKILKVMKFILNEKENLT